MEIRTLTYRNSSGVLFTSQDFRIKDAGVILMLSEKSQVFIPWHRVEKIEQTFSSVSGFAEGEIERKRLTSIIK